MENTLTLCFIRDGDSILLGMKKRGFGEGKWNGLGGKLKEGETLEEAVVREVYEESGLVIEVCSDDKAGVIDFVYKNSQDGTHEVHIYTVDSYRGRLVETEEIRPKWYKISEIPYEESWEDDKYWLPLLLAGKKFKGEFIFNEDKKLITHTLECFA
jgi:ADP-ribose pyrophosphatase YjhB (NUDIX family)